MTLLVVKHVPDDLCRSTVDDTVGRTHRVCESIVRADRRHSEMSGSHIEAREVPAKRDRRIRCDFVESIGRRRRVGEGEATYGGGSGDGGEGD